MPDSPMIILDKIVSEAVRRGSADAQGIAICVTCGGSNHWKFMDCGHFQRRGHIATRYFYKNLGVQCHECNRINEGENEKFAAFIDEFYGKGTADDIRKMVAQIIHDFPFEEETKKWTAILQRIVEKEGADIQY